MAGSRERKWKSATYTAFIESGHAEFPGKILTGIFPDHEELRRLNANPSPMDAILFKQRYDAGRLMADLDAAAAAARWIAKPEKEKHFKWSAIPLHSLGSSRARWHGPTVQGHTGRGSLAAGRVPPF
jgi:hypothetical protein